MGCYIVTNMGRSLQELHYELHFVNLSSQLQPNIPEGESMEQERSKRSA